MSVCKAFDLTDYFVDSNGRPLFWRCKFDGFAVFLSEPSVSFFCPDVIIAIGFCLKTCDCTTEQECIEKDSDDINPNE